MSSASKHWTEQARYDLDTARAMFDSGRYLYVLFCCQQAVEKALKAIIGACVVKLVIAP
jgi:HEPN domain-containing protein